MSAIRQTLLAGALTLLLTAAIIPESASAATPSPKFRITSLVSPTHLTAGDTTGRGTYVVTVTNIGAAVTSGAITITDNLPPGITTSAAVNPASGSNFHLGTDSDEFTDCTSGSVSTCVSTSPLPPGGVLTAYIPIDVSAGLDGTTVTNHVVVSGGGAATATATEDAPVDSVRPAQGFHRGFTALTGVDGSPVTQAGAHPYNMTVDFKLNNVGNNPLETVKKISLDLPKGLAVNPQATPVRCTESDLQSRLCPDASAVGLVHLTLGVFGFAQPSFKTPLYNMVAPKGTPAVFGIDAAAVPAFVHVIGHVRADGGYALSASADNILEFGGLQGISVDLWGDPSDPSHGFRRGRCALFVNDSTCAVAPQLTPFLTMPSACSGPLETTVHVSSWQHPEGEISTTIPTTDVDGNPVGVTGCDQLAFAPTVSAQPGTQAADSPTALDVELKVPQTDDHDQLATSNLKTAKVVLPVGMAVNPSSADGLASCTPAQIGLGTESAPACPDASKVGAVSIQTPLVPDPLPGAVYIAEQNDNPFNSLLALYIVVNDPVTGVLLKLAGKVAPDPDTGQLTATFNDNPQLPFSSFKLHFIGGERAPLISPPSCGTYQVTSEMSPWSAADPDNPTLAEIVHSTDSFSITTGPDGRPCPDYSDPAQFAPEFSAGTVTPQAGAYSPFVLKVTRPDGQQSLKEIAVTLPLGLTAKLAGVPRCLQSAIVPGVGGSTSCPAGSQVGTVTVGAGAGGTPFFLKDQPVYLTDGYDGAPFGLVIDTHALAGPFDLGHVVVRTKLSIDPITTQVSADAEPLPSIIDGIPLHIRSVALTMDRSTFVLNPTSCAAQTVAGQITGGGASFADPADDTVKDVASAFQVGGCSTLDLKPKLAIGLTGKGQTTDGKHPGVHAVVSQTPGQANLKKVVVSLPLSLALDPDNAQALCEFTDGSKIDPSCPIGSVVGQATARTPILDQALTGPVYFVKNIRTDAKSGRQIKTLPKLVIPLTGENGVRLNLVGTSSVVDNRLVTTFDQIPDAPVSDFMLDINGGKHGILVVSGTDICKATQVAGQQISGQNGKQLVSNVYLQTSACPLKIISKKVGKTSVVVKVGGLSAGKVTVSGKGIKKTRKTITRSTVATITARRTKAKPGKVTVSFAPAGSAKVRKTSK
jgi:uncharacterized repeat protein (TIGR01451 family)